VVILYRRFGRTYPFLLLGSRSRVNRVLKPGVRWLRRLVVGLSPQRPRFDPMLDHVRFVADSVALGLVLLRVLWLSPVSVIPSLPHAHPQINFALTRRTNGRRLKTFQKAMLRSISHLNTCKLFICDLTMLSEVFVTNRDVRL
jgi:hypothetical protein